METRKTKGQSAKPRLLPCGRARPARARPLENVSHRIASLVERFETYCNEQGLRKSNARRKIVEVIVRNLQHFTSQELVHRVVGRYPEVGRATLYRTIPVLVKAGILQEGPQTLEGHVSYELAESQHHDHIVCLDCREIFEFSSPRIEKEQDSVSLGLDFQPRTHSHVIYAHCLRLDQTKARR